VVLAAGESQSAIALTTYYNGVQPLTEAFDGFFVHSRAFAALPLVAPGEAADLAGSMANPEPVLLRDDLDAPALVLQAEGDVVGVLRSVDARQPDSATVRLWEVAGASHADAFLLGPLADELDCGAPINRAPFHLVAKAALRALDAWVRTGDAPPEAPRIEVDRRWCDPAVIVRDADGIAEGGIRLPVVDVPAEVLSGAPPPSPDLICLLMGSTQPLPAGAHRSSCTASRAATRRASPRRRRGDRRWVRARPTTARRCSRRPARPGGLRRSEGGCWLRSMSAPHEPGRRRQHEPGGERHRHHHHHARLDAERVGHGADEGQEHGDAGMANTAMVEKLAAEPAGAPPARPGRRTPVRASRCSPPAGRAP
jgi:hypothetical protein